MPEGDVSFGDFLIFKHNFLNSDCMISCFNVFIRNFPPLLSMKKVLEKVEISFNAVECWWTRIARKHFPFLFLQTKFFSIVLFSVLSKCPSKAFLSIESYAAEEDYSLLKNNINVRHRKTGNLMRETCLKLLIELTCVNILAHSSQNQAFEFLIHGSMQTDDSQNEYFNFGLSYWSLLRPKYWKSSFNVVILLILKLIIL